MRESELLQENGVRLGVGGGALLVVTAAGVAIGLPTSGFTAALVVVTGAFAAAVRRAGAVLLGVTGWALCTGFAVNELGELTFAPADLLRLVAYVALALALAGDRFPAQ